MICCAVLFPYLDGFAAVRADRVESTVLLCDLSFPQAAVTDVNTIYIPFTLVGQLIMLEASVDTMTGYFMLDTGSEKLILNKEYFEAGPNGRAVAAVGNTGMVDAVVERYVDSLQLDLLVVRDMSAHLVDLHHIELKKNVRMLGILG